MFVYPVGFLGGYLPDIVTTFTGYVDEESNASSYTKSVSFGAASVSRFIIVGICGFANSGTNSITSVTIGGIAAQELLTQKSGDQSSIWAFYGAVVPTGTAGNVVVNFSQNQDRFALMAWALENLKNTTPVDVASINSGTTTRTTSVEVKKGGAVISFCGVEGSGATAFSWPVLTEDVDSSVDPGISNSSYSGAHADFADADANKTITCTQSNSASRQAMLTLSMR